jgi:hypothetical protein
MHADIVYAHAIHARTVHARVMQAQYVSSVLKPSSRYIFAACQFI